MKNQLASLVALLLFSVVASAQTVKIPEKVDGDRGRLLSIKVEWTGSDFKYTSSPELDVFREYDPDPQVVRLRVIGYSDGKFEVKAIAASKEGKLSDFATCVITIGKGPGPGPDPGPGPTPDPTPSVSPIEGRRVLFVIEEDDKAKYPKTQLPVFYSQSIRDYLNRVTDADTGGTKGFRIWDKDVSLDNTHKRWKDAMARPRKSVPWMVVGNGKSGYEGPVPNTLEETMAILKKYLGE